MSARSRAEPWWGPRRRPEFGSSPTQVLGMDWQDRNELWACTPEGMRMIDEACLRAQDEMFRVLGLGRKVR